MNLKDKKIAILGPDFFGYPDAIIKSIVKQGGGAIFIDERPANDFLTKALLRLRYDFLIKNKIKKYYNKVLDKLEDYNPDVILLISPETIQEEYLKEIKSKLDSKIVIYMWDSIANKRDSIQLFDYADNIITFDHDDSKKYNNVRFLPLFYESSYSLERKKAKYDISFIGTVHSDRYKIISKLSKENISFFKFMYMPSRILYYFRRFTSRSMFNMKKSELSFAKISSADIAEVFSCSQAILDINHPGQKGLTSRTFESLGAGCKLITTNSEIVKYDFYTPDNIYILDRKNPKVDLSFFETPFNNEFNEKIKSNHLDHWIYNVINGYTK